MQEHTSSAQPKKKKRRRNYLRDFLVKLAVVAAAVFALLTFVLGFYRMSEYAMYPAVRDGDLCIVYKLDACILNDVVLYRTDDGRKHLGRIVAVGGQTVDFPVMGEDETGEAVTQGYTVNGYQPAEEIFYPTEPAEGAGVTYPYEVAADSYFIMNDFRSQTTDSRTYGAIRADQIDGKLIFVLRRRGF